MSDRARRDLCVAWMERFRCLVMEGCADDAAQVAADEIGFPVMDLTAWTVGLLLDAFNDGRAPQPQPPHSRD